MIDGPKTLPEIQAMLRKVFPGEKIYATIGVIGCSKRAIRARWYLKLKPNCPLAFYGDTPQECIAEGETWLAKQWAGATKDGGVE